MGPTVGDTLNANIMDGSLMRLPHKQKAEDNKLPNKLLNFLPSQRVENMTKPTLTLALLHQTPSNAHLGSYKVLYMVEKCEKLHTTFEDYILPFTMGKVPSMLQTTDLIYQHSK